MSEERKKPGVPFWTTVALIIVVGLPFLYLASLGPVVFLQGAEYIEEETWDVVASPAKLCGEFVDFRPDWFWGLWEEYYDWWMVLGEQCAETSAP